MKSQYIFWFLGSLLAGLLSIFIYGHRVGAPLLANDSYQYLDAAGNVASGTCLCTNVAHFDEQVRWAHMPIPFMHFGPAYPVAIAGLKLVGVPLATGGYLLSAAGYLLVICFIWLTGRYLELEPWSIALVCLIWSLNSLALGFGSDVGTDSAFTAILTGICALLAYDVRNRARPQPVVWLLLGGLVGVSYWFRQPGLFLFGPLFLYLLWRCFPDRHLWRYGVESVALAILFTAPLIVRNIMLTGSWNSGFSNGRYTPWKKVVSDSIRAPYHILFGVSSVARLDIWTALFLVSALVLIWRAIANRGRSSAGSRFPPTSRTILVWLLVFASMFVVDILVAEFSTYAASEVRYNFPVFPIALIACAVLFQFAGDRIGRMAAFLFVFSIAMVNARSLSVAPHADQSSLPADLLQQQVRPGLSMGTYIQNTLPLGGILVATEGQAVHYLLKRPVVSIIEPQYSLHSWNEADLKSVMRSFGAQYFVIFPGAGKERAPEQQAIPFLHALAEGHQPSWLTVAARTPGVILYHCALCAH